MMSEMYHLYLMLLFAIDTFFRLILESLGPVQYMIPVYRDVPRRISSRVYMMSLHRDVPGERDVSTSLKKVEK